MKYRSLNPATEELLREYTEALWPEAEERACKVRKAATAWNQQLLEDRAEIFLRMAGLFRSRKMSYAVLITEEMGKPIAQAEAEVEKCAWGCEFYAAHAEGYLRETLIQTDASKSYVRYDPLGVILGIMPWNFPFWQVIRFSVPALIAGNAVLLKPAPSTPKCALAVEALCHDAGLPEEIFDVLFLSNETAARLIASPFVAGVSLTGSSRAGREVAEVAGRSLKKCVLELGGSDPFIVFDDADMEKVIPMAIRARMLNAGQSCIAAKRFIVTAPVYETFRKKLMEAVKNLKVGDPMDRSNDLGPMARDDLRENLKQQVSRSIKEGATVLIPGGKMSGKGYYYAPTVLENVVPGQTVFKEEVFGPVVSLIVVSSEEEAIDLANQTSYGLGASLWTQDLKKAESLAACIEAGSVFINGTVKSDPRLPFGGIKNSGFGRELSAVGIREFTNMKTVWVA